MRKFEGLNGARAAGMAGVVFVMTIAAAGATLAQTAPPASEPAAVTGADPGATTAPAVPAVEVPPVITAAIAKLKDKAIVGRAAAEDIAAAETFYAARKDPLWVETTGFTPGGKAVAAEIAKAAEWGLEPRAFAIPDTASALASPDALGEADVRLTLAMLTYARHARGGRTRPLSISQMLDLTPPLKDPAAVLGEITASATPAAYLTGLHPRHDQFQRLQKELVRRMGPVEPVAVQDPSLDVKLPKGATLKEGSLHEDIALLRQRLKVPAPYRGRDTYFDAEVAAAVKAFQAESGIKANGQLTPRTRTALNRAGEGEQAENPRETQRLIVNMERWRWMPEDLGAVHVVNNVPEYVTRTFKDGKVIFKEKIIVGLPTWPTPSFSAEMKTIVFNPSWGVPDGIKAKELKPRLQKAGGGGFFDQLFGGGGGGGSSVLRAYGLTVYKNGKPVNPDTINWSSADLRAYSFIQPPGAKNPLGFVKFMFPNTHDVYMHDTIQRDLFSQSKRPYSHGCIRVQNPARFAEVLLSEDKGWSPDRVSQARRSSETITLDQHIWVHNVYMTTWIEDDGRVANFGDVYGLDSRVSRAIGGGSVPSASSAPDDIETSSIEDDEAAPAGEPKKKNKKQANAQKKSTSNYRVPSSFSDAMSGLTSN